MNLLGALILDTHARIAAETRGETPEPEATWALRTEVENGIQEDDEGSNLNLDEDTLEVYKGHNKEPLQPGERFYGYEQGHPDYYPVKHYRTFQLSEITLDTMKKLAHEGEDQQDMSDNTDTTSSDSSAKSTKVVYKYEIDLTTTNNYIEMPEGAKILHAHSNMFWALVDTSKPTVKRRIVSAATGVMIADDELGEHIGSAAMGGRVYHLFDCGS